MKDIWQLSNPNGEMMFSKLMFLITMQLINKIKKGVAIPSSLPPELIASASPQQLPPPQML